MVVDEKRAAIHAAAIAAFSAEGFAATSMGDIARQAGMSRPALYQYFRDKGDIFVSAFVALLQDHLDRAVAELRGGGELADRLDGFLQRFEGDLWERMAASPHSEELLAAKHEQLGGEVDGLMKQRDEELAAAFRRMAPGRRAEQVVRRAGWVELFGLAPKGFKTDRPSVPVYRGRLTALARSVAADVTSSMQ